jgi:hypothetical protein
MFINKLQFVLHVSSLFPAIMRRYMQNTVRENTIVKPAMSELKQNLFFFHKYNSDLKSRILPVGAVNMQKSYKIFC